MNNAEALSILDAKLAEYRGRSYAELRERIGRDEYIEVRGPSGVEYQIEVQVFWDEFGETLRTCSLVASTLLRSG